MVSNPFLSECLLEDPHEATCGLGSDLHVRTCSPLFARILRAEAAQVVGRAFDSLFSTEAAAERRALLTRAVGDRRPVEFCEFVYGVRMVSVYRPVPDGVIDGVAVIVGMHPACLFEGAARRGLPDAAHGAGADPLAELTPAELHVLELIAQGLSSEEIAKNLHRSRKTIEFHRASLGRKLGVENRVQLALLAIRAGLVPLIQSDNRPS